MTLYLLLTALLLVTNDGIKINFYGILQRTNNMQMLHKMKTLVHNSTKKLQKYKVRGGWTDAYGLSVINMKTL
jgi:hypothetical protein